MVDYLRVGVITSPHGLRGDVKVFPTTDDVNRFKKLKKDEKIEKYGYDIKKCIYKKINI